MQENQDNDLEQQAKNRAMRATLLRGWSGMLTGGVIGSGIAFLAQSDCLPVIGEAIKNFDNSMPNMKTATMITCLPTGAAFPSAFILGSTVAAITMFNQYPKMLEQERSDVITKKEISVNKTNSFTEKETQKKMQPIKAALSV